MEVNPFFLHICLSGNEFHVRRQPDKTGSTRSNAYLSSPVMLIAGCCTFPSMPSSLKWRIKTAKCSMDVSAQIKRAKKPSENSIFGAGRFIFSIIYIVLLFRC